MRPSRSSGNEVVGAMGPSQQAGSAGQRAGYPFPSGPAAERNRRALMAVAALDAELAGQLIGEIIPPLT